MRHLVIVLSIVLSACAPPSDASICESLCDQYAESGCGFTGCVEFCVVEREQAREGSCFDLVEQEYSCAADFVCDVASCRAITDARRACEAL